MSYWTKERMEDELEAVVDALELSAEQLAIHGPMGTAPAELVKLVLWEKDKRIAYLQAGFVDVVKSAETNLKEIKS